MERGVEGRGQVSRYIPTFSNYTHTGEHTCTHIPNDTRWFHIYVDS